MIQGHGTREIQLLWSRLLCAGIFQDLVETGPPEPEAASVSKEVMRATKAPNNLFNIRNLGSLGGQSEQPFGRNFDPIRVLREER